MRWLLPVVLVLTLAVAASSLGNGFTMDDRSVALGIRDDGQPNPRIHELQPLQVYFATHYWADKHEASRLYRPLTTLSFALRHAVAGDAPFLGHLANVLLHVLATWLVFVLARAFVEVPAAAAGAAVFGLHAIHSEVVASIVGRAELMAFCGGAGALVVLMRGRRPRTEAAVAGVLLLAAFASKESALAWTVFVPLFLLARGRLTRHDAGRIALAVGVPAVVFLVLRQLMIAGLPVPPPPVPWSNNPLFAAPVAARLMSATANLGYGLWLCFAPFSLVCDYSPGVLPVRASVDVPVVGALVVLALILAVGAAQLRRRPLLFLAMAAFLGFAFLTSNLPFAIGTVFGERLYYTPSLGVSFLVAGLAGVLHGGLRPVLRTILCVGLLAWLAASAFVFVQRAGVWRSTASLYANDVVVEPESVRLLSGMASLRAGQDQDAAIAYLKRALRVDPEDRGAWTDLGALELAMGRLDAAEQALRRALAAGHGDARYEFVAHAYLGKLLQARGRTEEATEQLSAALRAEPAHYGAFNDLLVMKSQRLLTPAALAGIVEDAARGAPARPHWQVYRGILAHDAGRLAAAVRLLEPGLVSLGTHPRVVLLRSQARYALGDALLGTARPAAGRAVLAALAADPFAFPPLREAARGRLGG